ncbi:hypothetical protein AB6A40_002809 [Gnathostoma spinigerum]|uniref:Uncharacterized protein n=1 Tax=Gnathostoma spinigerum TaxID=75299 RepID=A0ABD6E7N1_9BILA
MITDQGSLMQADCSLCYIHIISNSYNERRSLNRVKLVESEIQQENEEKLNILVIYDQSGTRTNCVEFNAEWRRTVDV